MLGSLFLNLESLSFVFYSWIAIPGFLLLNRSVEVSILSSLSLSLYSWIVMSRFLFLNRYILGFLFLNRYVGISILQPLFLGLYSSIAIWGVSILKSLSLWLYFWILNRYPCFFIPESWIAILGSLFLNIELLSLGHYSWIAILGSLLLNLESLFLGLIFSRSLWFNIECFWYIFVWSDFEKWVGNFLSRRTHSGVNDK